MKRTICATALGIFAATANGADAWDVNDNYVGVAATEATWTIAEDFPGTKLILDGRYLLRKGTAQPRERDCDCEPLPVPDRMLGTIAAHLQWGLGDNGLEYGRLSFGTLAYQREFEAAGAQFQPVRDTLEWGIFQVGKDDPLGIDSYVELTVIAAARTWQYRLTDNSPWRFTFGVNVSGGYAWADSVDDTYRDVSNPLLGTWWKGTISRARWGEIYLEQRVINGFTLSSPAAGGTVSREARARFGYRNRLRGCLAVDLFAEKRSFNFTDPALTDLYTKSKRVGVEFGCLF